jgi:hypothetical protein
MLNFTHRVYVFLPFCRSHNELQRKGRRESKINVWFPFMYSQKWNCYFQNRIIICCLPVPTLIYLREIIFLHDRSAYSDAGKYVDRSQTHKCGNWNWGSAVPRKGIHKWDFPCSAETPTTMPAGQAIYLTHIHLSKPWGEGSPYPPSCSPHYDRIMIAPTPPCMKCHQSPPALLTRTLCPSTSLLPP